MSFKSICLSGGGVNGYAHLGMLEYLYINSHLQLLDTIVCTSIGSVVGLLFLIGYTPTEIFNTFKGLDISSCFKFEHVENIFDLYGIDTGEYFIAKLVDILVEKKVSPLLTFKELYKTFKKRLIVCGTNVSEHLPIYFNESTYPDMKIIDAIRISISIPLLFTPVQFENDLYVDGFLTDNYPIQYTIDDFKNRYSNKELGREYNLNQNIIGCSITSTKTTGITNFYNYIYNLFCCTRKKTRSDYTIYIVAQHTPIHFSLQEKDIQSLFDNSFTLTKEYIDNLNKMNKKSKRYSI